uniref:Glycosyltransferase 2-like domain-containing protein n=1 Tax=viral metagenome TaxID=1070528 RepID=A0A6C0L7T3_9ZZZZ
MKYPITLLFRYDNHSRIDGFIDQNKDKMNFSVTITNDSNDLNKMFDSNNHLLITFGPSDKEYAPVIDAILPQRMRKRWIHFNDIPDINTLNQVLNTCYMNIITCDATLTRPIFSLFTTCYNSYDKIFRAYNSIKEQTLKDWEWVILDDSPEDDHFNFLKTIFKNDKRIRLYNRCENSGSIGNVKNEAVMLCRGEYVIEMDHDDEILPDCLLDAANVFDNDTDIGFVYMDFVNIYENGANFSYGDFFGLGYSGYYCQKHNNQWVNVAISPNINNVSLSHIVAIPNHPRIWRKSTLIDMGNYSEHLPVSDDYELILRTAVNTKIAKIPKLGYVQYMNNNNNNFSLIRNGEINRLCKQHLYPQCYEKYKINDKMKSMDAYEDPIHITNCSQIWKRKNYEYKYCNQIINVNHKKQYCIIGLDAFRKNKDMLIELYGDSSNDFLLLDNKHDIGELSRELDYLQLDKMKCYFLKDNSEEELIQYFHLIYKSCDDFSIIKSTNERKEKSNKNQNNPHNKLTIITPCIRPENLIKIKESIDFDYVNEWIIVYDGTKIASLPNTIEKHDKIKEHIFRGEGISGNPQRNFALELIESFDTYLYFLDDDNIIHPELYELLDTIESGKMYTFDQSRPKNVYPYKTFLPGNNIELFNIDTAMFLIDFNLCKDIRWIPDKYNADGHYIKECYEANKDNWVYVNKTMAYYNRLVL